MKNIDAAASAPMGDRALPAFPMSASDLFRFAVVCVQLAAVLFVIYQYQLESRTFFNVMALGFGGFAVHALLPQRYRPAFFSGLSVAAIVVALGLRDGIAVVLLGLLLIGISHLPIRMVFRVALLLATTAVFALWRTEIIPGPWSAAIWPMLGSMFMFRLALYLYALKHDEKRPSLWATLSYFFMLPNVCFPMFPVVDYSTFRRTYYDRDATEIYVTGIKWIVRGLVHLILYRLVYLRFTANPMELLNLADLVQFLLATFLLYLRISGQFHLITGVLHLFGFRLPETHHLYFLSSSFTDFWRRINIYWKDFMMKLVYYPSFFALKRFGSTAALVGATGIVFLGTWLLHSYQWFWLRGGFPLAPQDGLFWGLLGALVVIGALKEMKRSRARKLGKGASWNFSLGLRTVATFAAICILWSLWSAQSLDLWLLMWGAATNISPRDIILVAILVLAGLLIASKDWSALEKKADKAASAYYGLASPSSLLLAGLIGIGATQLYAPAAPAAAQAVASLQRTTLNTNDIELQHKGYYENLDNSSRMSAQLWDVTNQVPADWVLLSDSEAYRARRDFVGGELRPNVSTIFMSQRLTTNSWGMRDKERTLAKPEGIYRIAVVGPSHVMGNGIADEDTITRLLEERLNQSQANRRTFEVLNFGVGGYALTQQLAILEEKVFRFEPDAIFFVVNSGMGREVAAHLLRSLEAKSEIPFQRLQAALHETGVDSVAADGFPVMFDTGRALAERLGARIRMPSVEALQRLNRATDRLVSATFEEMAASVRARNIVPVYVALGTVSDGPARASVAAKDMLVFDMLDLWQGHDMSALRIAAGDNHPNAAGTRMIAERLHQLILEHASELGLDAESLN